MEPDHRSVTDVLDARVSASTYLAMLGICVFPIRAIGVAGGIRNSNWLLAYVAVGMALCIIIGLSVFRLKILNGVLYYREFARYQTINIGDIDRAMIETPHRGKGLYQQLSIYGRIDSTKPLTSINLQIFSRDDLRKLFDALGSRLKSEREIGLFKQKI